MTTIADDPAASLIDPPKTAAAAVSYLRVSTREQAEKGGTDEGFSIPAQLKLLRGYAADRRLTVTEEFVDVETLQHTNQQLIGRLALKELGQGITGPLLRGAHIEPESVTPRKYD